MMRSHSTRSGAAVPTHPLRRRSRGSMAVEFALVAAIFIFLLLGITDLGRWFFAANAASEAARLGARLAVVCSPSSYNAGVLSRMADLYPQLVAANVSFVLGPASCDDTTSGSTCMTVTVRLNDLSVAPLSPFLSQFAGGLPLPAFSVTLPRESMQSSGNSVCN
jgi:Flp pilus assembly protein TadG